MKTNDIRMISAELKKIVNMQIVRIMFIFSLVFSCMSFLGDGKSSALSVTLSSLSNLTQTLIIVVFIGFTAYIYGIEVQSKTLKIIRSKHVSHWKVIGVKYLSALIVVCAFIFAIGLGVFAISTALFPIGDFQVKYASGTIAASQGLQYIFLAYLLEAAPIFLVACFCLTLSIYFKSPVLGAVFTFFIYIVSKLIESVKVLKILLPSHHLMLWQDIVRADPNWGQVALKLAVIFLYCGFFYVLSVHRYKTMEVDF